MNSLTIFIELAQSGLRLGTGSLQVSLSWNNYSDTDLHVIDPYNEEIYYQSKQSSSGGALDRDDTNGHGPENIYWLSTAPDGLYKVYVKDYSGFPSTDYYITISSDGVSRNFSGNVKNGRKDLVTTVEKRGRNISFR
jgi:uncharacterized protein YfaP (DUF2135 family)